MMMMVNDSERQARDGEVLTSDSTGKISTDSAVISSSAMTGRFDDADADAAGGERMPSGSGHMDFSLRRSLLSPAFSGKGNGGRERQCQRLL